MTDNQINDTLKKLDEHLAEVNKPGTIANRFCGQCVEWKEQTIVEFYRGEHRFLAYECNECGGMHDKQMADILHSNNQRPSNKLRLKQLAAAAKELAQSVVKARELR